MQNVNDLEFTRMQQLGGKQEELSILTILQILYRRIGLFSLIFFSTLSLALLATFFVKPVYESRAVFLVPRVSAEFENLFPSPITVASQLIEEYEVENPFKISREFPIIHSVRVVNANQNQNGNLIIISARGHSVEEARDFLQKVISVQLQKLESPFEKLIKIQQSGITEKEARYEFLQQEVKRLVQNNDSFSKENLAMQGFLIMEKAKMVQSLSELDSEILILKSKLVVLQSQPPVIIKQPSALAKGKPIQPRTSVHLFFGTIVGLVLALCVVLLADFLKGVRVYMPPTETKRNKDSDVVGIKHA